MKTFPLFAKHGTAYIGKCSVRQDLARVIKIGLDKQKYKVTISWNDPAVFFSGATSCLQDLLPTGYMSLESL